MRNIFKMVIALFVLVSFLALPRFGFAGDYSTAEEVKKEEEEKKKAFELEEVVVTATRTETPIEHVADSVTVITHEDIEMKGQKDLYEVLKDVPGISMKRCGGPGQWTYVRMRGGHNRHIKVLINGMSAADPRAGDFADYWSYLDTEDIERIEIVRGPQSALYGSEAVSGVINIITKKGKGKPKFYVKGETGSMDTYRGSAGVNGEVKGFSFNLDFSHDESGGVFDHEEHESDTVSGRLGYSLMDNLDLDLSLRYTDAWINYNQWDYTTFRAYDDPHSYRDTDLFFSSIAFNHKITSWWDHTLSFAYTDTKKEYDDPDDGVLDAANNVVDSWSRGTYKGKRSHVLWQHNFHIKEINTISAGYEYEDNEGESTYESAWGYKESKKSIHNNSWYFHNQLLLFDDALSFTCGGRLDDHSTFGDHTTYKVGLAYLFKDIGLKLRATHGTGFKAPNMFQLYDARYGNPELEPEESKSWDIGFEQKLFQDKVIFEATYFDNKFENLIVFDYATWRYANRETAKSHGVEVGLRLFPLDDLSVSVNYTYTDGEENDKDLAIVPKDELNANITYAPGKFKVSTDFYYVGERLAYDQKHKVDSYTRVDLSASYQVTNYLNIYGRIENLFDEAYEGAAGYPAPDFSAWGGVKLTF